MIIELDKIIYAGDVAVAALVKSSVHCCNCLGALSVHGTKRPCAILIRRKDVTMAFEIDGSQIDLDEFERRYPGQRATFERLAITDA